MPSRQRDVLQSLLACRTSALGGALHHCPQCDHRHFSYHSCNNRHCPQCGGQETQQWLVNNAALLLPLNYFLVTFTVPEGLSRWIRSHPALGYDLLLAASSQALQDLAHNPKRLGATLGLLGVLPQPIRVPWRPFAVQLAALCLCLSPLKYEISNFPFSPASRIFASIGHSRLETPPRFITPSPLHHLP